MKSIQLIFGCHSHQPVGNFGFVFEEAYEKSYLPFLDVLERYPAVKATLHYTGPLLDWFAEHHPDFLQRLARMSESGQVEIMGGAYYEPLLCAIPERDAIAQIERMHRFCEEHFGKRPGGMWLAERVWEPHMPSIMARAGVRYAALDDSHFAVSGIPREECFGYYQTDDEGYTIKVFPIIEKLRYTIPFRPVEETIAFLRERATEDGKRCAVFHDDGEKFGVWPGTYHSVYEEGWLEELFAAITENQDWLKSVTYEEYMADAPPLGRTYLTCASYSEMMGWALPTRIQRDLHAIEHELEEDPERQQRFGPFVRGGFWRNFMAIYPEANNLQKRMIRVSRRLQRLRDTGLEAARLEEAEKFLHQAQCNCSYWHGVFGGLYLNHLRTAVYECCIKADRAMDPLESLTPQEAHVTLDDMDCDGNDEIILEREDCAVFVAPADGGSLYEWDHKPTAFNLLNTLARREELYHDHLHEQQGDDESGDDGTKSIHDIVHMKEEGLADYLAYDRHRRSSLRDRLFPVGTTAKELWSDEYEELSGLPGARYEVSLNGPEITLSTESAVHGDEPGAIRVTKVIELLPGATALRVRYTVENLAERAVEGLFGTDWVVNFLTGSAPDRYYESGDSDIAGQMLGVTAQDDGVSHIAMVDEYMRLRFALRLSAPAKLFRFPIETISQSEGGQERVYQGSAMVPAWRLNLGPGEQWQVEMQAGIESLEQAETSA